jgi:predicted cobalt transporter CbtA
MRRFLSIATVAALLSSLATPVMAACTGTSKAASCHAMETPHAGHAMHHHHHQAQAEAPDSSGLYAADNDAKCPMDCCTAAHPQNGAALAATSIFPPLAVSDQNFYRIAVVFISAGFSSHTDRGPPLA